MFFKSNYLPAQIRFVLARFFVVTKRFLTASLRYRSVICYGMTGVRE